MSTEKSLLPGATRDLAAFASNLRFADIPHEAVERMKLSVLDSIGCCLFGATLPWTRKVATLARAEGAAPVASLAGMGEKTSIALAALVNGTGGHAFELDDIHKESIIHAGSIATPIALAFAEQQGGAPGRDIITAMIAGYEVGHRVGNAATMSTRRAPRAPSSPPPLRRAHSASMRRAFSMRWGCAVRRPAV